MTTDIGARQGIKSGVKSLIMFNRDVLVGAAYQRMTYAMSVPVAKVKIDASDSYEEYKEIDCKGNEYVASKEIKETKTEIEISFGTSTLEMKALGMGRSMKKYTTGKSVPFASTWFPVPDVAAPALPASVAGVFGSGVVADAQGYGSALIDGISTPLTQANFAGFSVATPLSFAVGVDGEMKFSDDLRGRIVSIGGILTPLANVWASDGEIIKTIDLDHYLITPDGLLMYLKARNISLERSGIDFSSPEITLKGSIADSDYELITLAQKNRC